MFWSRRPKYRFYPQERTTGSRIFSVVKLLILVFLVHEIVATFFLTSFRVDSQAMQPALEPGDNLLVSPLAFGAYLPLLNTRGPALGEPEHGDLVVIRPPYSAEPNLLLRPLNSVVEFFTGRRRGVTGDDRHPDVMLRRVIAVPGDTVRMEESIFYVRTAEEDGFVSEFEASRLRYPLARQDSGGDWPQELPFDETMEERTLGEDEFFLAADNRSEAIDSRYGGAVAR
ncbi:MAG: signal peptidase I, partial [Spirochaetota bacterium]